MDITKATTSEIKQLRKDARKLVVIARHLKDKADALAKQARQDARTEKARTAFFSRKAKIDPELLLTPKGDIFDEN